MNRETFLAVIKQFETHNNISPSQQFEGDIHLFAAEMDLQHTPVTDAMYDRPPTFVWSDTPFLGVGNSSDHSLDNVALWLKEYTAGDEFEIALFNNGQIIYRQYGYP